MYKGGSSVLVAPQRQVGHTRDPVLNHFFKQSEWKACPQGNLITASLSLASLLSFPPPSFPSLSVPFSKSERQMAHEPSSLHSAAVLPILIAFSEKHSLKAFGGIMSTVGIPRFFPVREISESPFAFPFDAVFSLPLPFLLSSPFASLLALRVVGITSGRVVFEREKFTRARIDSHCPQKSPLEHI